MFWFCMSSSLKLTDVRIRSDCIGNVGCRGCTRSKLLQTWQSGQIQWIQWELEIFVVRNNYEILVEAHLDMDHWKSRLRGRSAKAGGWVLKFLCLPFGFFFLLFGSCTASAHFGCDDTFVDIHSPQYFAWSHSSSGSKFNSIASSQKHDCFLKLSLFSGLIQGCTF